MRKKSKLSDVKMFVVSAPSGAGKTTLCQKLSEIVPNLKHSISYTTRPPRKREINNIHYTFVSKKKFKAMIQRGEFVEWAVVHGNLYGTSKRRLEELAKNGCDIVLDIDTSGAAQIRSKFKDAVYIFILPPSLEVLRERLRGRMTESDEEIKRRINRAKEEIADYRNYNYVIINNEFKKALRELESIIIAERLRTDKRR